MALGYRQLLLAFGIDLVAIATLTYGLYVRRHQRRDLTLGLVGVNIGLFAVSSFTAVTTTTIGIGFGIGLFALLSVIRLRSMTATQEEIGYYFLALVIGLVNGLAAYGSWGIALVLNAMLLGVMYVADHPRMLANIDRRIIVLDRTQQDPERLLERVEAKIGFQVTRLRVLQVDYRRGTTRIDVRFRTDRPAARPAPTGPPATMPTPSIGSSPARESTSGATSEPPEPTGG